MSAPNRVPAGGPLTSSTPAAAPVERTRATALCLIVHDELELRLRLAGLVRRAAPRLDADTVTRSAFESIAVERLAAYAAILFIVEFSPPEAAGPSLASLARVHQQLPALPLFVFARGGNERSAARAMKLGASDYWPIHAVVLGELTTVLQPIVEPVPNPQQPRPGADPWRQPEIAGYSLIRKIAHSDLASVYLARNAEFPQPIALKVQSTKRLRDVSEADRNRFMKECDILSKLNHRSIANILDFGVSDDYQYLALEYFPCGSLRDRLRHPVSEADALGYAHQIGEALQIVHAARIVHRDLKPSNLMLTNDNRLVLIDFGSARAQLRADDARGDDCTGTPYYVCPEQADDRDPDVRGDLYSLGVVLFELLTGLVPFQGRTVAEILTAHRSQPVPRLPQRLAAYQALLDRLLAKSPGARYADAAQFLDALDALRTDIDPPKTSKTHRSA